MLRNDGDYIIYQIHEYQFKWNRWMQINTDHYYIKHPLMNKYDSGGACWQQTGVYGLYDLDDAKKLCNELLIALKEKTLNQERLDIISDFVIVKCELSQHKTHIPCDRYIIGG